jgi:hypothetical protein
MYTFIDPNAAINMDISIFCRWDHVCDVALKRFIYLKMEFAVTELFNLLKQRSISFMHAF